MNKLMVLLQVLNKFLLAHVNSVATSNILCYTYKYCTWKILENALWKTWNFILFGAGKLWKMVLKCLYEL